MINMRAVIALVLMSIFCSATCLQRRGFIATLSFIPVQELKEQVAKYATYMTGF